MSLHRTLTIYHVCHLEVNLHAFGPHMPLWLRLSAKCVEYKYHNIQIKPCQPEHHARGEQRAALRQQLAHICLWTTYKLLSKMSVSQLWLQLVGQTLMSSIHHVDTGVISVCDCVCVFEPLCMEDEKKVNLWERNRKIKTRTNRCHSASTLRCISWE